MAVACALLAILVWSSLATLSVSLGAVPPLMLIGLALGIGGLLSVPWARRWSLRPSVVATGVYGMLGYHLLFVLALRHAPPVSANLVQYTWPMLIVLLSPLVLRGTRLKPVHALCALAGFAGAALAIAGSAGQGAAGFAWGYVIALAAAVVWSTFSLMLKRPGGPQEADLGLACLVSGAVALALHAAFEPAMVPDAGQWRAIVALGAGPMGIAFYLWSFALRRGDPRVAGVLANATPVLSSLVLVMNGHGRLSASLLLAGGLVSAAGLLALVSSSGRGRSGGDRPVPAPAGRAPADQKATP